MLTTLCIWKGEEVKLGLKDSGLCILSTTKSRTLRFEIRVQANDTLSPLSGFTRVSLSSSECK
jgi:hypothetical protein